jgi:hypothetical protein
MAKIDWDGDRRRHLASSRRNTGIVEPTHQQHAPSREKPKARSRDERLRDSLKLEKSTVAVALIRRDPERLSGDTAREYLREEYAGALEAIRSSGLSRQRTRDIERELTESRNDLADAIDRLAPPASS